MTIADPRFTAEAITGTGRSVVFDDVGCLAAWLARNSAPIASTWVTSFVDQREWMDATRAVYLRSNGLRTPMASGLAALRPGHEADSVQAAIGGTLLSWHELLAAPLVHAVPPAN
jgi:copper chaperone NosL